MTPPIVLVHGLWLTPRSWEHWKARFEERGHEVLAPAWPHMDGEVEAIRRDPSVLNGLGVTEIVDHYDQIIRGLCAYHPRSFASPSRCCATRPTSTRPSR